MDTHDHTHHEERPRSPSGTLVSDATEHDPVLAPILSQLEQLADTDDPVLLVGETGTGTELAARALHNLSSRAAAPFAIVDCAESSEALLEAELRGVERSGRLHKLGAFEQAGRGTLFLAEVGALSPYLQELLLQVLDRRSFVRLQAETALPMHARCLASTSVDLRPLVDAGLFHPALHARLAGHMLTLAPLRERPDDVLTIAQQFLVRSRHPQGQRAFDPSVETQLRSHPWPGNIHELHRALRQAALASPDRAFRPEHFANLGTSASAEPLVSLRDAETRYIRRVLQSVHGNQRRASRILGISRWSLARRLRKFGLKRPA
jgi:DNA-binding NtrC family response regulator